MAIGYCYEASNEYILKKLIKYIKTKNVPYCIYGFYLVSSVKMDFEDFRFKTNTYYLHYVGEMKVDRWLNNDFESEVEFKPELFRYCFKLKKYNGDYWLFIKKKKYKLHFSIHLIPYFYHKMNKEFFEKDYNLIQYNDNINAGNNFSKPETFISLDTKYDKFGEDDYISSYDMKGPGSLFNTHKKSDYGKLNFEPFFKNYFIELTENQQKITALLLLGIRITDIARLLSTSQVYCTLEMGRLGKKINKLYNKKRIEIYESKNE